MPIIDLGINFQDAEQEANAALKPMEPGFYEFEVLSIELMEKLTSAGQKRLKWTLKILSEPYANKKVNHFTTMPSRGNTAGVSFLIGFLKLLGAEYDGSLFDTDRYIGLKGIGNFQISSDGKWNELKTK